MVGDHPLNSDRPFLAPPSRLPGVQTCGLDLLSDAFQIDGQNVVSLMSVTFTDGQRHWALTEGTLSTW